VTGERVAFMFDGRPMWGQAGGSIGAALHAAGVRVLSHSAKYRRPRGLRCGAGWCPCCAVRVDGVPGVPACVTPLRGGERVERERPYLARLPLDRLSRLAPAGFYYERLAHAPRAWSRAERVLARLAGVSRPPDAPQQAPPSFEERDADVLVVGAGRAGMAAAAGHARSGKRVLVVDRDVEPGGRLLSREGGEAEARQLAAAMRTAGADLILEATALGRFDDGVFGVATASGAIAVRAGQVVYATGSRDREHAFPDGDRPGVLLAGAVERLIVRDGVSPGDVAVVAGGGEHAEHVVRLLQSAQVRVAAVCAPADLAAAHGRHAVTAVTLGAGRRVACDLVVLALGREPADELSRQP
jgi:sarcosine oxidase, subunit alpha